MPERPKMGRLLLQTSLFLLVASANALYDSSDDVIQLTESNFDKLITKADGVAAVEFYAPCK